MGCSQVDLLKNVNGSYGRLHDYWQQCSVHTVTDCEGKPNV